MQMVLVTGLWWPWWKGSSTLRPRLLTKNHCWGCRFPFEAWKSSHQIFFGDWCCFCQVVLPRFCLVLRHNCTHCYDIWKVTTYWPRRTLLFLFFSLVSLYPVFSNILSNIHCSDPPKMLLYPCWILQICIVLEDQTLNREYFWRVWAT